ncbi:3',5'-cyclic AMP phosphodiesterase CpdA [Zhouia amylolytica]|uniref:3',5'-cyclic AMP phosphodiesterase CpdA n=1 Tax=Zhouia amylolytica TaxID=376730 RepID=A0A1I6TC23_9FLAO|nr:metallophosphoesterase [Zhouia amylolytica]MCQ0112226.1 metallophosphoesterase [Zhouia amylolytica]SFS86567.1 3',5'-cyclic AMP phosphodiesterase CpdA [Zhouia amylolytica]
MKLFLNVSNLLLAGLFVFQVSFGQESFTSPKLSDPDSWSIILLPDTQSYVKFERNHGILETMTGWISENIDDLNIKMVLCTGDLVEQNELLVPDDKNGNLPSRDQWRAISHAFETLDGKVPYILAAGNHDFGYKNVENRKTNYIKYFPAHRNLMNARALRAVGKNADEMPSIENAAYEFVSPHDRKFLFVNLEFAPRDTTLEWAKEVLAQDRFQQHTAVVLTHSYLNAENQHIEKENYPIENGNYGKAIWDKLIAPSRNVQMVFSGHIGAADNFKAHTAYREDKNAAGKKVNQITFNAQAMGGGWHGNGGDGWLRIMEFLPDGKTVIMRTFSPHFALSPSTQELSYSKDSFNNFTIQLD